MGPRIMLIEVYLLIGIFLTFAIGGASSLEGDRLAERVVKVLTALLVGLTWPALVVVTALAVTLMVVWLAGVRVAMRAAALVGCAQTEARRSSFETCHGCQRSAYRGLSPSSSRASQMRSSE
jgi:hypothetical protein